MEQKEKETGDTDAGGNDNGGQNPDRPSEI